MVRDFDLLMKFNRFSTKFDIRKVNLENCVLGVLVTPSPALDYNDDYRRNHSYNKAENSLLGNKQTRSEN